MKTAVAPNAEATKAKAPKLSVTEAKLLRQIQAKSIPQPSWVTYVGNSHLGFI